MPRPNASGNNWILMEVLPDVGAIFASFRPHRAMCPRGIGSFGRMGAVPLLIAATFGRGCGGRRWRFGGRARNVGRRARRSFKTGWLRHGFCYWRIAYFGRRCLQDGRLGRYLCHGQPGSQGHIVITGRGCLYWGRGNANHRYVTGRARRWRSRRSGRSRFRWTARLWSQTYWRLVSGKGGRI